MEYVWLILAIAFAVGEVAAPGLISIWFALSAGIMTLVSKFIVDPMNEFYLFVLLSLGFLVVTRPISKKILSKRNYRLEDRIIGQVVIIEETLDDGRYEVTLDGKHWKAVCREKLEKGDKAKVLTIEGIKLILEKE